MLGNAFSIEAVVIGRNDDYEPDWNAKLFASIAYNRRLFEGTNVDFRVAFVEWNPPPERPLLAQKLVDRFPFVRVIVVEPSVHRHLCEDPNLQILINFSCNAALRSSVCDYVLITGGDEFFGTAVAQRIVEEGLRPGCLYRAERANIRETIDFTSATADVLELPENLMSVDVSVGPPYTNACGDFLLLDRGMMCGLRGLDETVRGARLHVDSRFAINAMIGGAECEMLGRIFHINHRRSYRNVEANYPGRTYRWDLGLPYVNRPDWGLNAFNWQRTGERVWRVGVNGNVTSQEHDSVISDGRSSAIFFRLVAIKRRTQPEFPRGAANSQVRDLDLTMFATYPDWGSTLQFGEVMSLETSSAQWAYAAALPIAELQLPINKWHWLLLRIAVPQGAVGVGVLTGSSELVGENIVTGPGVREEAIVISPGARMLIIRNVAPDNAKSVATIIAVKIVSESRVQEA